MHCQYHQSHTTVARFCWLLVLVPPLHGLRSIGFDYSSPLSMEYPLVTTLYYVQCSITTQGTMPFMSLDLLQEFINPHNAFIHTYAHDLESLIYIIIWICNLYQAPHEIWSDKIIEQTCLKQWSIAKNVNDIEAFYDQKLGQLMLRSVLDHFTLYCEPLKLSIAKVYKLIQCFHDPDKEMSLTHTAIKDILTEAFFMIQEIFCDTINVK